MNGKKLGRNRVLISGPKNSLIKKENIKIGVYQFEVGEIYNEIGDDRKTSAGYISVFIEKPKGLRYEGFFIEAGKDDREPTKWLLFRITHEGKFNGYRKDLFGKMFGSGWDGFDDAYFAFGVLGDVNEPIETLNLFTRNSVGSVRIILMDAKPITNNQ